MAVISIGIVNSFGTGLVSLSAPSYVAGELVESKGGMIYRLLTAGATGGQIVILPSATVVLDHHVEQATASAALTVLAAFNEPGVLVAGVFTDRIDPGGSCRPILAAQQSNVSV